MSEAQFEYKCRRCGKTSRNPCCDTDLARFILTCISLDGNKSEWNQSGSVHMLETHYCKDGGMGISDLQGFRVVGDN